MKFEKNPLLVAIVNGTCTQYEASKPYWNKNKCLHTLYMFFFLSSLNHRCTGPPAVDNTELLHQQL